MTLYPGNRNIYDILSVVLGFSNELSALTCWTITSKYCCALTIMKLWPLLAILVEINCQLFLRRVDDIQMWLRCGPTFVRGLEFCRLVYVLFLSIHFLLGIQVGHQTALWNNLWQSRCSGEDGIKEINHKALRDSLTRDRNRKRRRTDERKRGSES